MIKIPEITHKQNTENPIIEKEPMHRALSVHSSHSRIIIMTQL